MTAIEDDGDASAEDRDVEARPREGVTGGLDAKHAVHLEVPEVGLIVEPAVLVLALRAHHLARGHLLQGVVADPGGGLDFGVHGHGDGPLPVRPVGAPLLQEAGVSQERGRIRQGHEEGRGSASSAAVLHERGLGVLGSSGGEDDAVLLVQVPLQHCNHYALHEPRRLLAEGLQEHPAARAVEAEGVVDDEERHGAPGLVVLLRQGAPVRLGLVHRLVLVEGTPLEALLQEDVQRVGRHHDDVCRPVLPAGRGLAPRSTAERWGGEPLAQHHALQRVVVEDPVRVELMGDPPGSDIAALVPAKVRRGMRHVRHKAQRAGADWRPVDVCHGEVQRLQRGPLDLRVQEREQPVQLHGDAPPIAACVPQALRDAEGEADGRHGAHRRHDGSTLQRSSSR
mmetsp:Transcript_38231/g.119354  ORF Transcript_38231/g.119354 Transcript_38231/m.119354 type:complete len:396 (-) Transcript_38231:8-1195(-)